MKIVFEVAAISDMGLVRKNNEDNLFVPFADLKDRMAQQYEYSGKFIAEKSFFCVCDGMGGHNAGEIASDIAVNQVRINYDTIIDNIKNKVQLENIMGEFIKNANKTICDCAEVNPECAHMGTTMCGVFFLNGTAYGVNIGDSRLYYLDGRKASQISVDHADSIHTNAITRYLGMPEDYGEVTPDVLDPIKIGRRKRFLICSDGLSDMLEKSSIETLLRSEKHPMSAAKKLVEEAKKAGGRDNITVLVIDVKPASPIIRTIMNPVLAVILAAAIAGGSIGMAAYKKFFAPVEGDSLEDIVSSVQNIKSLAEADESIREILNEFLERLEDYRAKNKTFQSGLDDKLTSAKHTLEANIDVLDEKIDKFKTEIEVTIANEAERTDEERLEFEKNYTSWETYIEMEKADKKCAEAVEKAETAKEEYDARQDEIKRQKQDSSSSGNSKDGGNSRSGSSSSLGSKSGSNVSSGSSKSSSSSGDSSSGSSDSSNPSKSSSSSDGSSSSDSSNSSKSSNSGDDSSSSSRSSSESSSSSNNSNSKRESQVDNGDKEKE